ncbi:hypothetical protein AJ79_07189 [Helicocarpus griseus UAMH5409]|uniref:NWD NACHT-NTPase N-terminal domain-containing protein n=1 Tax=Helicocarpus griseus UAMH5409 TaxID=1447875 RepID=A0A2B7X5C0_9EURO|nr:hypothetical protein AJ79_07189 [Helicocarpus griseus UAMH5409]
MGPSKIFLRFTRRKAKQETRDPPAAGKESPKPSSCEVPEPSQQPVIRDQPPRGQPKPEEDDLLIAQEIWDEAYSSLKGHPSSKELLDEFETGSNSVTTGQVVQLDAAGRRDLVERQAQKALERAENSSKSRQTFLRVSSLIEKTKAIVHTAVSACPPAAVAWGVTCLLVVPIVDNMEQANAMQDGLSYVISKLPWYTNLIGLLNSDAWKSPKEFRELRLVIRGAIVDLYKLLILYQLRSLQACTHTLGTWAKNAVKWHSWEDMLEGIQTAEKGLEQYMQTYHNSKVQDQFNDLLRETAKNREELTSLAREQLEVMKRQAKIMQDGELARRKAELLDKVKPDPSQFSSDRYHDYLSRIDRPHRDTGDGVLTHPKFAQWAKSDKGLLVLAGHPGTGKSVLANHLLEELPMRQPAIICSFFFKDTAGQTKPHIALCKVLHEFLRQIENFHAAEEKLKQSDRDEIRPHSSLFWNVLDSATRDQAASVIFDALDECDPEQRPELLERLSSYQTDFPRSKVKFLLTMRPFHTILGQFDPESILNLDDDSRCRQSLSRDIAIVARNRLEKFAAMKLIEDQNMKNSLFGLLKPENDRTYLFVKLLFDFLEKQPMPLLRSQWFELFKQLPTTVEEAYVAFLGRVDERSRDVVKTILELVLAAAQPLTLTEMNIALIVNSPYCLDCEEEDQLQLQGNKAFKTYVLESCGFFLDVYNDRIYFIHQTVKDFLLPKEAKDDRRPDWLRSICIEACHRSLAERCFAYLSLPFVKATEFMHIEDYSRAPFYSQAEYHRNLKGRFQFGEYAFSKWVIHLRNSHEPAEDQLPFRIVPETGDQSPETPINLAMRIFTCSTFASHVEARVLVDSLPAEHMDRDNILTSLSESLLARYHESSEISDVNYAISLAEEVVGRTPQGHPCLARRLAGLCRGVGLKYERTGTLDTLNACVEVAEKAVDAAPPGHPDYSLVMFRRAVSLESLSEHTKDSDALDRSIEDATRAVKAASPDDPDRAAFFNILAICLGCRYLLNHSIQDINQAIYAAEKAVNATPDDHIFKSRNLNTLGIWLDNRYKHANETEDLDRSIEVFKKAMATSSPGEIERPHCVYNLSGQLAIRYRRTKADEDRTGAIEMAKEAVRDTPDGDRWLPTYSNWLEQVMDEFGEEEETSDSDETGSQ